MKKTREEYNTCMKPFMAGSKTKEQRQHDMCVGAKICSGKASSQEEAEKICSAPRLPKWARQVLPKDEKALSCDDRLARARQNIDVITLKMKSGEAEEVKAQASQVMNDIFTCFPEPAIVEMVNEALGKFNSMASGYYFKGETKELQRKLTLIREVLV